MSDIRRWLKVLGLDGYGSVRHRLALRAGTHKPAQGTAPIPNPGPST